MVDYFVPLSRTNYYILPSTTHNVFGGGRQQQQLSAAAASNNDSSGYLSNVGQSHNTIQHEDGPLNLSLTHQVNKPCMATATAAHPQPPPPSFADSPPSAAAARFSATLPLHNTGVGVKVEGRPDQVTTTILQPNLHHPFASLDGEPGELGGLVIVSDLDCAIGKEEVVEAVDYNEVCVKEEECVGDSCIDTLPPQPLEMGQVKVEVDEKNQPLAGTNRVEQHLVLVEEEEDEEYACELRRNRILTMKFNNLNAKVAKIRALIQARAKSEASEVLLVAKTDTEAEVEIRSEGEHETELAAVPAAAKRSRNHSWPQMTTSSAAACASSAQRKKEQNKLASKRFRERKKMELAQAQMDITELEVRNSLLATKANSMQAEADNLKKILLDLKLIQVVEDPSAGYSSIVKVEPGARNATQN